MSRYDTALKHFNENRSYTDMRVNAGIEQYRKGNATIAITDKSGTPIPGAKVIAKQKDHEFKYGANIFMLEEFEKEEKNKLYKEYFKDLFNIATIPFYWSDLEPEQGKPRFAADSPKIYRRPATDLCVEYCLENGVEPKCHCLNYDMFTPEWAKYVDIPTQKKMLDKRFRELSERYADIIPMWEVTNETLRSVCIPIHKTKFYYEDDFVSWSFKTAEKYFPLNHLIINDYAVWDDAFIYDRSHYYAQIRRLIDHDRVHLDSVGMQYHSFFPKHAEEGMAKTRYNPIHLFEVLDTYAKLGKKIQITEMTLPAYSNELEDEDVQAELLKETYSVFFSHPAMEAIIYWNLVDGYAAFAPQGDMTAGENKFFGGLITFDFRKKPAYHALKKLFSETWHTEKELVTDEGGFANFRGFYGNYDIKVASNGKEYDTSFFLSSKRDNFDKIVIEE